MAIPSPELIHRIINSIDWTGHIEIGDSDKQWLAHQIHQHLTPSGKHVCESCGLPHELVIKTRLGMMCESCIEEAAEIAEAAREEIER